MLPTYAQAGIIAPILLIIMRILQGTALGGEYGGAAIYVAEHAPNHKRGAATGWIQSSASFGLQAGLQKAELIFIINSQRALDGIEAGNFKIGAQAGITVVNAPTGNTIAAAEHTLALLSGIARKIAAADASLRRGDHARSSRSSMPTTTCRMNGWHRSWRKSSLNWKKRRSPAQCPGKARFVRWSRACSS